MKFDTKAYLEKLEHYARSYVDINDYILDDKNKDEIEQKILYVLNEAFEEIKLKLDEMNENLEYKEKLEKNAKQESANTYASRIRKR